MVQMKEIGVRRVCFSGGEPTLRSDLADLIHDAHSLQFRFILITTNGLSLTRDKARRYLENGLNRITISIDGIGESHDLQRGVKGAYEKTLSAVKMLAELRDNEFPNLDIELETTLTLHTIEKAGDVIRLCQKLNVGWMMSVFENDSFQFRDIEGSDLRVKDPAVLHQAFAEIRRLKRGSAVSPMIGHVAIDRVSRYLTEQTPAARRSNIPCVAGFTAIYVNAHGKVFPGCWALPPVGDIRETPLRQIVRSPQFKATLRKMFAKNCPTCPNSILWGSYYYLPALVEEAGRRIGFSVRGAR